MKYFDEEKQSDFRKRSKRANNIPGVGMRTINQYLAEDDDGDYEYDDEYEVSEPVDQTKAMYK